MDDNDKNRRQQSNAKKLKKVVMLSDAVSLKRDFRGYGRD